jgi:hypothetical protein
MASTRLSAAAYEIPSISPTCATVSISPMFFFLLMCFIKRRFQRSPMLSRRYVVLKTMRKRGFEGRICNGEKVMSCV